MRWMWTVVMAMVVAFWIWGCFDHQVHFRHAIDIAPGATIFFKSGGLGWIAVTLIGALATGWHLYCSISYGRLPLWSVASVAIWSLGVVVQQLVDYWQLFADYGWGFTGWGALQLAANLVFFVAALKSCEIALADRHAARG